MMLIFFEVFEVFSDGKKMFLGLDWLGSFNLINIFKVFRGIMLFYIMII